ncbi:MAG: hypothetical protein J6A54_02925, partial [Clostridia bacterium]|nr:hypothetical protein [Clostridia bacterium]
IIAFIVERSLFGKNGGETYRGGNRPAGAAVGVLVKLISFVAFIIPLIGYITIADDFMLGIGEASSREIPSSNVVVEVMSDEQIEATPDDSEQETPPALVENNMAQTIESLGESCLQLRNDVIAPLANDGVCKIIHTCGGKWIFDSLTSTKVEGTKVSLYTEIDVISNVYYEAVALLKVPMAEYGDVQTQAINNITNSLDQTTVAPSIISGLLSYSSKTWLEGGEVFGVPKVIVGDYYEPTLDKILNLFAQTTEETVKKDIHMFGNIANICIEQGAFVEIANSTPINIPKNEEFMGQIFVELYNNDKARPLAGDLLNAFENYLYRIYNEVNGTDFLPPEQIVMDNLTVDQVYEEGKLVASILNDFSNFYATVDMNETDNTKFLIQTDVRSLGKALDKTEKSLFLGDSYNFLLTALLRSEGASQFAFMTPEFAESMINRNNASMESVLVARQEIAIIIYATKGQDREEAIKHILENVDEDSAKIIKETLTTEVMTQFGMNKSQSESMSNTLDSVITQIANNDKEFTDEELQSEIEAVGNLINVVKGATNNEADNLFADDESDYSKSNMSASDFVETVVESEIISSAIQDSSVDENGNKVENPYNISGGLTDSDKESAKTAIEDYYSNNQGVGDNEELRKKLDSLANVLGVDVTLN